MKTGRQSKIIFYKNQKYIFPLIVLAVVIAVVLSFWLVSRASYIELDGSYYQYFIDSKREYQQGTKVKLGKNNISFHGTQGDDAGDESPIYAANDKRIILSENMYWFDVNTGIEYQIPALATIVIDETGTAMCSDGESVSRLQGGFLGDSKGLYIFLEPVNVGWSTEGKQVNQLSFFSCDLKDGVRIYDYDNKELIVDANIENISYIKSDKGYSIDVAAGIYSDMQGKKRLLVASPKALPSIFG